MAKIIRTLGKTIGWAATGGILLAGGAYLEHRSPVLRKVSVPALPRDCAPVRILHLSDLHLTFGQEWLVKFVQKLADTHPDLVISTGDNFSTADGMGDLMRAYEPLLKYPGAFVFGSNDYHSATFTNPLRYPLLHFSKGEGLIGKMLGQKKPRTPDLPTKDFRAFLTEGGWADLNNATATIALKVNADPLRHEKPAAKTDLTVSLSGIDDPHIHRNRPAETDQSWPKANLRIGLTHAPYLHVLDEFSQLDADIVFAGHTHGGQVCLPGGFALTTNCDLPAKYASGIFAYPFAREDEMFAAAGRETPRTWVHVSNGLGTNPMMPLRLFCRPSATLVTLEPQTV